MNKNPCLKSLILCCLFIFSGVANAGQLEIKWDKKKLSIKARGVTLCEALDELEEKTNTEVRNSTPCNFPINLDVNNLSFEEGVKRLLRNGNYVLVINKDVRRLLILDRDADPKGKSVGRNNEASYDRYPTPEPPPYTVNQPQYDPYGQPTEPAVTGVNQDADIPPEPVNQAAPDVPPPEPPPVDPQLEPQTVN